MRNQKRIIGVIPMLMTISPVLCLPTTENKVSVRFCSTAKFVTERLILRDIKITFRTIS